LRAAQVQRKPPVVVAVLTPQGLMPRRVRAVMAAAALLHLLPIAALLALVAVVALVAPIREVAVQAAGRVRLPRAPRLLAPRTRAAAQVGRVEAQRVAATAAPVL
jgi:hypothetical protein